VVTKTRISTEYQRYFSELQDKLNRLYEMAKQARGKGLDPSLTPEPEITQDIAERIEKLIGPPGIGERIRELEAMDRHEMAFKVAEDIVYGRFGKLEREKAADQSIRTALAIMTEGVTIAPIQGIPEIRIKRNPDRSQYLAVYFAGPIRPAGGTAQALTLVVADFVRRRLGLDRYRPSEEAVKRFVEEVRLYERRVRRFQYHVTDEHPRHRDEPAQGGRPHRGRRWHRWPSKEAVWDMREASVGGVGMARKGGKHQLERLGVDGQLHGGDHRRSPGLLVPPPGRRIQAQVR